tara:strand:+ start:47 stop:187 length:141 start_codon:yes stop_codon:yes gene_type:complete
MQTLYIPENKLGVMEGYYNRNQFVKLMRDNCKDPKVIYFLADMLEE